MNEKELNTIKDIDYIIDDAFAKIDEVIAILETLEPYQQSIDKFAVTHKNIAKEYEEKDNEGDANSDILDKEYNNYKQYRNYITLNSLLDDIRKKLKEISNDDYNQTWDYIKAIKETSKSLN